MKKQPQAGFWRPTCSLATARRRAAMLAEVRRFFADREVLEVETPTLSAAAVSDPHIESIAAIHEATAAPGGGVHRYLHTSPEHCMKRLLCAGFPDIYSMCRVFRAGEAGPRHQPEFTMIEWYRRGYRLDAIVDETCELLTGLLDEQLLDSPPQRISYSAAFERACAIDPLHAGVDELVAAAAADERLRSALGTRRDDWLDLLMAQTVVPGLPAGRLTIIERFPATHAALAQLCPDDDRFADRFEVFLGDMELANGYVELLDPAELRRRWLADQRARRERGLRERPLDEALLAALQSGLPPCAGVAAGFDRLLMLNERCDDIRRVQTFDYGSMSLYEH